jgi:hypothetical protein
MVYSTYLINIHEQDSEDLINRFQACALPSMQRRRFTMWPLLWKPATWRIQEVKTARALQYYETVEITFWISGKRQRLQPSTNGTSDWGASLSAKNNSLHL